MNDPRTIGQLCAPVNEWCAAVAMTGVAVELGKEDMDEERDHFLAASRQYTTAAADDQLPVPASTTWAVYKNSLIAKDADITSQTGLPPGWKWNEYHTVSEIRQLFQYLAATYPDIVDAFHIGSSRQKKRMYAIKVSAFV